jgi:hypothetical protein
MRTDVPLSTTYLPSQHGTSYQIEEITQHELDITSRLASDFSHLQRKDAVLLEQMKKKQAEREYLAFESDLSPQTTNPVPQIRNDDAWEATA